MTVDNKNNALARSLSNAGLGFCNLDSITLKKEY